MKKLLTIAALVVLVAPAAYAAPPEGKGKPESPGKSATAAGHSAEQNAAKACKAERGTTAESKAAFREKYGTNKNKANAFGKCVSAKAKAQQEAEERRENASKMCKAERESMGVEAFKATYGTNPNKANAFGKCVSAKAKAQQGAGS